MRPFRVAIAAVAAFAAAVLLTSVTNAASPPTSEPGACPANVMAFPPGAGDGAAGSTPPGAGSTPPGPGAGMPNLQTASSIAPSDNSTSTVLDVAGDPQIQCGSVAVTTYSDIVYATPDLGDGTSLELRLDVIVPDTPGPRPLVIFLPGGGFVNANKCGSLPQRTYLAEAGFTVAALEYRTVLNGATFVEGVADVKSAIRFLRANADDYGIDPANVAVWGESAGGYMAAMVGTTNGDPQFELGDNLTESSDVQAAIVMFGGSDLSLLVADFDAAMQESYGAADSPTAAWVNGIGSGLALTDDPAAVARANPITYVDASDPAFLLFHGDADVLVSPSQTLILHTALLDAGASSARYMVEGAGHGDLAVLTDPASAADPPWTTTTVVDILADFLTTELAN